MTVDTTLPRSSFTSDLMELNGFTEPGFNKWFFPYGMRYNDTIKWWGDLGLRPLPHEGTDFLSFIDLRGQKRALLPGTMIPVLFPAKIIRVIDDMVAQTIIAVHDLNNKSGRLLHSFYAHVNPTQDIAPGVEVLSGKTIGLIASPRKNSQCPAHLHLSAAWIRPEISKKILTWEMLTAENRVQFVDPLELICP